MGIWSGSDPDCSFPNFLVDMPCEAGKEEVIIILSVHFRLTNFDQELLVSQALVLVTNSSELTYFFG